MLCCLAIIQGLQYSTISVSRKEFIAYVALLQKEFLAYDAFLKECNMNLVLQGQL